MVKICLHDYHKESVSVAANHSQILFISKLTMLIIIHFVVDMHLYNAVVYVSVLSIRSKILSGMK